MKFPFVLLLLIFPLSSYSCQTNVGQKVYVLYGWSESSLKVHSGNVINSGDTNSKIEFDYCSPSCFKWMDNCAFFESEYAAKQAAEYSDKNHTSLLEGTAKVIGGGIVLLIGATLLDSNKKEPSNNPKVDRIKRIIDSIPQESDHKKFDDGDLIPLN